MITKNVTKLGRLASTPGATPVRVDHRDGAGHLDPKYEASLRLRVQDRAQGSSERAFVSGSWSDDQAAEESAEEFVTCVTSGQEGGEGLLEERSAEEDGGPFVETDARAEFAYGTDASNPLGATREPFPTS